MPDTRANPVRQEERNEPAYEFVEEDPEMTDLTDGYLRPSPPSAIMLFLSSRSSRACSATTSFSCRASRRRSVTSLLVSRSGIPAAYGAPRRHTMPSALAVVKRERGAGVLQSVNLWSRPVTLFACTFASGCATEARIAEFFRELARQAGFEPATLG